MRTRRAALALLFVLLPGLMLAPVWRLAGLGASEDDILYYYPSRVFFHETIRAGHWPWLNPYSGLDRPYAADPQSALWYPLTWLFTVLPPLWAYPANLWAHCCIALWGMYRLLRAAALDRRAAIFGSIAFAFSGFLLAHRAHFTMQHAAAWTPWVFWRMQCYIYGSARRPSGGGMRHLAAVACVAALQCFAGHMQIAAITLLGSLVYLLAHQHAGGVDPASGGAAPKRTVAARWLVACVCAAGLFAVQWLPTLAYVRICTRVDRMYVDFVENSWNPASLVGWVLPMLYGQRTPNFFAQPYWGPSHQCEQFGYAGLIPLFLAALALRGGWRADRHRRPWIILLLFGLALALGTFGPICPALYWIPGSSLFRVPARALLLCNLALAALAAGTLHDLAAPHTPPRVRLRAAVLRWTRRPLVKASLLVGLPLVLVGSVVPLLPDETRRAALWALRPWNRAIFVPLAVAGLSCIALRFVARRWRQPGALWVAVVVTAGDLGVIGWTFDVPAGARTAADLLCPPEQAWLAPVHESDQRLWVVTDSAGVYREPARKRAANTSALVHVRALTDYGPLQPRAYDRHFAFTAWGVTARVGELLRDTSWMRPFNVGWILLCGSAWPRPAGCDLATTTPAGWSLYHNPGAAGMALFEDPAQPGAVRYVERNERDPSSFVTIIDSWPAEAASRSPSASPAGANWPRVIVSRLALPGWQATANGERCATETAHDALLAVRVPPGQAVEIEWTYFPPALREGALISVLSAAAVAVLALLPRRQGKATGPA